MEEWKEQPEIFEHEVLDTAMDAGHLLLENGAEIARVEETMQRICRHYGVDGSFFVLSNGIMTTGNCRMDPGFARVRHIPVRGAQLSRVEAVNQLSRDVESKNLSLPEVQQRIEEIRAIPEKRHWVQILASALGSACFCLLFGGTFYDCFGAFITGALLWILWLNICAPYLSKITGNLIGGAFIAACCIFLENIGIGNSLNQMIIGAVIPLVPGVAFTNGIRDIAAGDYISGVVRLLDALLVFACIAIGVSIVIGLYSEMGGAL